MRISLPSGDSGGAESANCTGTQRETAQTENYERKTTHVTSKPLA